MDEQILFLKEHVDDWIIAEFARRSFPVKFLEFRRYSKILHSSRLLRIISLHLRYLRLSCDALINSKRNDIIVCHLDLIGLYVFILSKIFFKKRYIVIINIMYNSGSDILTKIKGKLYRIMLSDALTFPTVAASGLKNIYRKSFNIPEKNFYVLHDSYSTLDQWRKPFTEGNNSIFCGGVNGRDWDTLLKVGILLPDIKFVIVGPGKHTLGKDLPDNIEYLFNITHDNFFRLLSNSSIVILPLNTDAPAGLIVLLAAGIMSKPVITTESVTMKDYIIANENGYLVKFGDAENFARYIEMLIGNLQKQREIGENFSKTVNELNSQEKFIGGIIDLIEQIKAIAS